MKPSDSFRVIVNRYAPDCKPRYRKVKDDPQAQ